MRNSKSKPLPEALRDLLGELGLHARLQEYEAVQVWPEVVGSHIAAVTEAKSIRNGTLLVKAKHSVWRHELNMRAPELAERLNKRLGSPIVKEIKVI